MTVVSIETCRHAITHEHLCNVALEFQGACTATFAGEDKDATEFAFASAADAKAFREAMVSYLVPFDPECEAA